MHLVCAVCVCVNACTMRCLYLSYVVWAQPDVLFSVLLFVCFCASGRVHKGGLIWALFATVPVTTSYNSVPESIGVSVSFPTDDFPCQWVFWAEQKLFYFILHLPTWFDENCFYSITWMSTTMCSSHLALVGSHPLPSFPFPALVTRLLHLASLLHLS